MRRSNSLRRLIPAIIILAFFPFISKVFSQQTQPAIALEHNINPVPENEAVVGLYVNRSRYGDVEARIDMDDPFIKVSVLREALSSALSEAQNKRIFSTILSSLEWAGIADLEAAGIKGTWDMETLSFSVETPGEYASLRELDFSPRTDLIENKWLAPAPIAAVVNFNISGSANIDSNGSTFPLSVNADGLLNLWSLAIESSGSASYSAPTFSWSFNSAHSVYDFPKIEGRLFAGMVTSEGISNQSRPEIYGIALHNVENFSRYDKNYSPSVAFTLQKPSTVRFKINGVVVRVLKLDMGNYRVFDLPFAYGLNQLELEIEDGKADDGTLLYRPISKYITTETGLLIGGKADYGFSAGIGRIETDQPIASAYVRYGLASFLTMAANLEIDRRSLLTGLGVVLGTDLGGIILDTSTLVAWDGREVPFAFASDLEYHYALPGNANALGFGFSTGYASRGFTAPQPVSAVTVPESFVKTSANIGGSLSKTVSFGLSGQWNRLLSGALTEKATVSLNFGFAIGKNASFSVSSGVEFATDKSPSFSASFALSASDPLKPGRHLGFTQPAKGGNTISYNDQLPVLGGLGYGIQATNLIGGVSDPSSIYLSTGLSNQYLSLSGSAGVNYGASLPSPTSVITMNLSTALSFAGGSFAISKPLYDSFIIFDPDKTTGDMAVAFSIDSGSKFLSHGAPIASPLSSYRKVRATMDFPEADADVQATLPQIALSTGYRTGFLFKAGLEKRFYVSGRLVDASGSPIAFMAGDILKPDDSFVDQTFTDDAGSFSMYGLTPGKYKIVWPENVGISILTLIDDADGLIELGDITATPASPAATAAEG